MFGYIYYSASDPTHRAIEVSHPSLLPPLDDENDAWVPAPSLPAMQWMAVMGEDGPEAVPFERPAPLALAIAATEKRAEVNGLRLACEVSGCETPLGRVDTDGDSQRKINGAVTMALIAQTAGQPFTVDWTMADNSLVTHDAPAMIAMGVAVGQHVSDCHERGAALKAEIDAADTVEEIEAVDIYSGWPGEIP